MNVQETSRFYSSPDGLSLHYREYVGVGQAEFTIVCVPGLTRNGRDFESLALRLAGHYRVLCVDLRGRGRSQYAPDPMSYVPQSYVTDLAALFDHEGLEVAALIGTSLGGMVSTLFSALMPERVLGVVLNDVGPEIDPRGLARIASYVGQPAATPDWAAAAAVVRDMNGTVYPDYGDDDWLRMARQLFAEDPAGGVRFDYDMAIAKPFGTSATTPDQWPYFRRMAGLPALLLRGAESDILARETVDKMQAAVPSLQAVEVPGRGHVPDLSEAESVAAIDAFLAGLPRRLASAERAKRRQEARHFAGEAYRAGVVRPAEENTLSNLDVMQHVAPAVAKVCQGIAERDFAAIKVQLAPHSTWTIVGRPDRFQFGGTKPGEPFVDDMAGSLAPFSEFSFEVIACAQAGDTVFVEALARGLVPPAASYSNRYLMRFTLAGDLVADVLEHYDPFEALAFVEQLGG